MNIVKASHTADPNGTLGNSHDIDVVALPEIVNAPTSILQDSQDEIYNSAFAAVNPAGNRFSSNQLRQLRYPSEQVGVDKGREKQCVLSMENGKVMELFLF